MSDMKIRVKKTKNLTGKGMSYGATIALIDPDTKVMVGDQETTKESAVIDASEMAFSTMEERDDWLAEKTSLFKAMRTACHASEDLRLTGAESEEEDL